MEASAAYSNKDFAAKMSISSKEARETKYWLTLLDKSKLVEYDYSEYILKIDEIINNPLILSKLINRELPVELFDVAKTYRHILIYPTLFRIFVWN